MMNIQENPYIGLRPYTFEDKNKFFGRDEEKQILFDKILANKLTLLFAASGVGKSSLLRAGIIPELLNHNYDVVYFFEWADQPELNLKQAIVKTLKDQQRLNEDYQVNLELPLAKFIKIHQLFCEERLIIILDQFEEFFNYARLREDFKPFIESLSEAIQAHDTTTIFVLSMREDFAMELNAFKSYVSGIFDNFYRLEKLTKQAAQQAILKPLEQVGFKFEDNLLEKILDDLSRREQIDRYGLEQALQMKDAPLFVEPPHLQIVCSQLWELELNQQDRTIHFNIYEKHGKAQGFLKNHFISKIYQLNRAERMLASAAFDFLVNKHGTKMAYSLEDLSNLLKTNEKTLEQTLNKLEKARILRKTERRGHHDQPILWFELYHDAFAKSAYEWNEKFKSKQRRKKLINSASITMGSLLITGVGIDVFVNTYFQYLQTNPQTNVVEIHQGYLNSLDIFRNRRLIAETLLKSEDFEGDKRFDKRQLIENNDILSYLTEKLPLEKRIKIYLEMGEFEKATNLAKSVFETNDSSSKNVIQYLVDSRSKQSLDFLESIVKNQNIAPAIRQQFSQAILYFSHGKMFGELLTFLLKDNNKNVRSRAIDALGRLQATQAIPQLIELLKDNDKDVRSSAINALVKLQATQATSQLIELLKDNDKDVRSSAIDALVRLQAKESIPQLLQLGTNYDINVRNQAISALSNFKVAQTIPVVLKHYNTMINAQDPEKRNKQTHWQRIINQFDIKYLRFVEQSKLKKADSKSAPNFWDLKEQILNEKSTNETKVAALRMMGQLETKEAAEFIIEQFKEFGVFAIQALGDTKQSVALEFLKQYLETLKESHVTKLQEQSYLETEVAHSIAKLDPINEGLKLLEHPLVEVRNGAIFGIGHFANFNTFKKLLETFENTSLNEPIKRFALYRAIDVSLMTLESDAKLEDLNPLIDLKEKLQETTHQHKAIKQRLEWTINEIDYRLKNPKDEFEETSFKTSKKSDDF